MLVKYVSENFSVCLLKYQHTFFSITITLFIHIHEHSISPLYFSATSVSFRSFMLVKRYSPESLSFSPTGEKIQWTFPCVKVYTPGQHYLHFLWLRFDCSCAWNFQLWIDLIKLSSHLGVKLPTKKISNPALIA